MVRMRRVACLLLTLVMVIGMLPMSVFATDNVTEIAPVVETSVSDTAQTLAANDTIYVLAGGDFQEAGDHAGSAENVRNILTQISNKYNTMDGFLFVGDYDCETHESDDNGQTAAGITALMGAVQDSYSNINDANSILVQGNHDIKEARIDATGGHDFDGYSVFVLNEDDYPDGGGTQTGVQTLANNLKTWLNDKLGEGYDAPIFITSHLPLAFSPRTNVVGDGKYAKLIFDVLNTAAGEGLNIIFMHGHNHAYGNDNYLGGEAIYLPKGEKINIAELGNTTKWTQETLNFTYMNAGYVGYYNDWNYVTTEGTDKLTMTVFAINGSDITVERYSANGLYNLKSEGRNGRYVRGSEASADSLGLAYNTTVYASPQTIALTEAEDYGDIGSWVGVTSTVVDDVKTTGSDWITLTEPTEGATTYAYKQATSVSRGSEYVIVANDHSIALQGTNNIGSQNVTISGTDGSQTMTSENVLLTEWTFSGNANNNSARMSIYNGRYYLVYSNGFKLNDRSAYLTVADIGNNFRIYSSSRYFYYNGSQWTRSSNNSQQAVRLFVRDEASDKTTESTSGLYAYLKGELTYDAAGKNAAAALQMVKDGIDIQYATAADYSDEQNYLDDGEGMTWTLDTNYDPSVPGDYAVTIAYNGTTIGTAEVVVPASTTYYAAEGNGLYLVDMNTTEDNAMAAVKEGITVYSATDASGSNKTAISDDDVTWNWVDKYNGADSGPYTVEILKDGTSLGTVEVKVDIKYETGIETDWTYIGETAGSGGTTTVTYTLDTDGIDYGEEHKYIIVDDNEAIALNANSASNGTAHSISISGNTATLNTRDYEYHMIRSTYNNNRYELITKGDGSQYLYQESNGVRYGTRSSVKFQVNHHGNGVYDIHDIDGTNWYIIYNGGWTVTETTSARVRLYKYTGTTGGTPGGPIYALIEGNTVYTVSQGSSATKALAAVKAGITGYTATDANGTGKTEISDSDLTWKWKNTFNGNSIGSYWVEISYQGKVLGTVEVKVEPGVVNNYPEYPDEGSVKVNKTGTGIDFQSSGIAQVEVSASGVPIKKGADVIVMLDTSSSMAHCLKCGSRHDTYVCNNGGQTRAQVLEESLADLIAQFNEPGADGQLLDIRVAIGDFNGFNGYGGTTGTPYDRDEADHMNDTAMYTANGNNALIYTGNGELGAGAFVNASELKNTTFDLNYDSGTNYDYAMDAAYQMGAAIKEANGSEERDLYVIFMSDGAAMQWNYYHSQGASNLWENWITGAWTANQLTSTNLNCTTHAYYYDLNDHDGDGRINEHRMANAIKGDPSERYEVIRKTTAGISDIQSGSKTNLYTVPGLGAKMFAIAFDPMTDTNVEAEHMVESISTLASDQTGTTQYFYNVATADALGSAFTAIGSEIAYAAYNARFVDQMGDDYNLQLKTAEYEVVNDGATTKKTLAPVIEVLTYDIYTKAEADAGQIPTGKHVGDRKGTSSLKEVVKFSGDGTKAYSNLIDVDKDGTYGVTVNSDGTYTISDTDDNILNDGVISATTFWYNTNSKPMEIDGVSIPTGKDSANLTTGSTNKLPAETFYWKMGTVQTSELAMRYYVYLDGSMEGTREGGSYPTNEYATLYYENYLHNPCKKDTVSPVMAWKEANVSYAFYLVDENGNIIVNQTTGQTGSFANKIAVTKPVVYDTILLNNLDSIRSIEVASNEEGILPEGYELYDGASVYTITINSNTTGSWEIVKGDDKVASTYVTQYKTDDASAYSNALKNNTVGDDYTHTVVWFAVLWKVQALPDSVVIDYGLPVDISVLANDMFGEKGKLAGVGGYSDSLNLDGHDTTLASGFGTSYTGTYGTAKADANTGKVRYTVKNMQMNGYEKFAYAVNYTGKENAGYYYDTVTVIPATTIYYEDSFLTYGATNTKWENEGTAVTDATQAEDRPGQFSLTDANNIYGYDHVNKDMSTFSLGTAKKVHVDGNSSATASFTFYGTGFDIIGMTSNTTGVLAVKVTDANGNKVKSAMVNTYYGCNYEQLKDENGNLQVDENGEPVMGWVPYPDVNKAVYQVPVMQIEELPYGQYNVVMTATYASSLDKTSGNDGYDLYLDAVRIYDPANDGAVDNDNVIEDAYVKDHEGWPSYIELRNHIIEAKTFDDANTTAKVSGMVFIDGDAEVGNGQISDYQSYGPNNEVYLAAGQSVAFILDAPENLDQIHIGMKSADGNACSYEIYNIARRDNTETGVKVGQKYHEKTAQISTATDMYYDITGYENDIVVIKNNGSSGILSLTNIKTTYKTNPNAGSSGSGSNGEDTPATAAETAETEPTVAYIYMTKAAALLTVDSMNGKFDEDTTPDETVPEETEPETTVPEETEPEETEPEETVPEETEPEVTEPETFDPAISVKLNKTSVKVGQKVQVKVTTSGDVAYLTVNGETVTKYSVDRRTGERSWSLNVTAAEAGQMTIEVIAYNDADIASDAVIKTVNVTKKSGGFFGSFFGWIFG